ncbi:unnamed protein product, partial [Phaeothamnion confervicola]
TAELWHHRLGHTSNEKLDQLRTIHASGIRLSNKIRPFCEPCILAKSHRAARNTAEQARATEKHQLVHTDLLGPMVSASRKGHLYVVIFVDDFTRMRHVYFMRKKTETLDCFKQYVCDAVSPTPGAKILRLRADNGTEFTNSRFRDYCREMGTKLEYSAPYMQSMNGVAERSWRTIMEMARSLLKASQLKRNFWNHAVSTAVHIINHLPSKATAAINFVSPLHAWTGNLPSVVHLRRFGCPAYVHQDIGSKTHEGHKRGKLDDRARPVYFIGYPVDSVGYEIWDPHTNETRVTVSIDFNEMDSPEGSDQDNDFDLAPEHESAASDADPLQPTLSRPAHDGITAMGESVPQQRKRSALAGAEGPPKDPDFQSIEGYDSDTGATGSPFNGSLGRRHQVPTASNSVAYAYSFGRRHHPVLTATSSVEDAPQAPPVPETDPLTYLQAERSGNHSYWVTAMEAEYQALQANGTWRLVPKSEIPNGRRIVGSKWVYKTKLNPDGSVNKFKARLVAQGFSQIPGMDFAQDNTYAPVARMDSIRTVLAMVAQQSLYLHQMDVDSAYLNSPLEEEIYMKQPKGMEQYGEQGQEMVCLLQRSLYGLKQAASNWHRVINTWLIGAGFTASSADPCIYIKTSNGTLTIIGLYVDDLLLASNSQRALLSLKTNISRRFKMKDLGELRYLLGMEVARNKRHGTVTVTQRRYIHEMLERYELEDARSQSTPATPNTTLSKEQSPNTPAEEAAIRGLPYKSLVGSLLYASTVTRPDISNAVREVCSHMENPGQEHWKAAVRILRYLAGTSDVGITYGGTNAPAQLIGYVDSDWGGDRDNRRSTTGYIYHYAGGPISWNSRLQTTVALSSTEAEYMAACAAAQEAIHLRQLLKDLHQQQRRATTIYEDNQGCIALGNNPVFHRRTKHIDIRYHFVRERIASKEIALTYIPTGEQLADMMTKNLNGLKLAELAAQAMGY